MIKLTEYTKLFESENKKEINEGLFSNLFGSSDKKKYGMIATLCNQLYDAKMRENEIKIEQKEMMSKTEYKKKNKQSNFARKEEAMNQRLNAATAMVNSIQTQITTAMGSLGGEWADKANTIVADTDMRVQRDIMQKAESILSEEDYEDFKKDYEEDVDEDEEYKEAIRKWQSKHSRPGAKFDLSPVDKGRISDDITDVVKRTYVKLSDKDDIKEEYNLNDDDIVNDYYIKVKVSGFKTPTYFALLNSVAKRNKLI